MGLDRPDIQFAAKGVAQRMAVPSMGGLVKIKRACRYLVGAEKLVWKMGELDDEEVDKTMIDVWVDSDWAGGKDRKSTSGGMIVVGGVALKTWSRTQKTIALSSGEAEFYGMVSGAAEGLGFQSLAADLGWKMAMRLKTDSAAGKGMTGRRGVGKVRHLEIRLL